MKKTLFLFICFIMFSFLIREIASSRLGGINTQAINGGASRMTSRKSHLEEIRHADPKESLFARVVGGTIPVDVVYEDEHVLAFNDINPQAPHHILVIPKVPIGGPSEFDVKDEQQKMILGHLLQVCSIFFFSLFILVNVSYFYFYF